jgi:hypothetical protein
MTHDGGHEPMYGHKNLGHYNDSKVEGADAKAIGTDLNDGHDHQLFQYLHKHHLKIAETVVNKQFGPCLIVEEKVHGHEVKFEIYGNKKEEKAHGVTCHDLGNGLCDIQFADGDTIHSDGVITNALGQQIFRGDSANPNSLAYKEADERARGGTDVTAIMAEINALGSGDSGATTEQLQAIKAAAASLGSNPSISSAVSPLLSALDMRISALSQNHTTTSV